MHRPMVGVATATPIQAPGRKSGRTQRRPGTPVRRPAAEHAAIQRKDGPSPSPARPSAGETLGKLGSGAALPSGLAATFSSSYGRDLSGVQIHTDSAVAADMGARAFTVGNHVAFAPGHYQPESAEGSHLIAHELAHVVQQSGGVGEAQGAGLEYDGYEAEADRAANAAVAGHGVERLTPVRGGASAPVQRKDLYPRPTDTQLIRKMSPQMLFPGASYNPPDEKLASTKVPLAKGMVEVFGLPLEYDVHNDFTATGHMSGTLLPGMVDGIELYLHHRPIGNFNDVDDPQQEDLDVEGEVEDILRGDDERLQYAHRFGGRAHASIGASFNAWVKVDESLGADLKILRTFDLKAKAGLTATPTAFASARLETGDVDLYYERGSFHIVNANLIGMAQYGWRLDVGAYVALTLSVHLPDIPVVTGLVHEVSTWPVIGWVVPDPEKIKWEKTWRKEWPIASVGRTKTLDAVYGLGMVGELPSPTLSATGTSRYVDLSEVLKGATAGAPTKDQVPKKVDDTDPSERTKIHGVDPTAVASTREGARARIAAARTAIARERAWDATAQPRVKKAKEAAQAKEAAKGGPKLATVPTGMPAPQSDEIAALDAKEEQIERRETQLAKDEQSTQKATQRVDEVQAQAEPTEEGPGRNEIDQAYQFTAEKADALATEVEGRGKEHPALYKRPTLIGEDAHDPVDTADEALEMKIRDARWDTERELQRIEIAIKEEMFWAEEEARLAASNPELDPFRDKLNQRRGDLNVLDNRWSRLESMHATIGQTVSDRATQPQAYEHIARELKTIEGDLWRLGPRPTGGWDERFVLIDKGKLLIRPEFRKDKRPKFFGSNYRSAVRIWRDSHIHKLPDPSTGRTPQWWWYDVKTSSGSNWWLLDSDIEGPTIDHLTSVSDFWNARGRLAQQPERRDFLNGWGEPEKHLLVVPFKLNRMENEDKMLNEVGFHFRGPDGDED
jgi:hypothetical protein